MFAAPEQVEMDVTWPGAVVLVALVAGFCFCLWLFFKD